MDRGSFVNVVRSRNPVSSAGMDCVTYAIVNCISEVGKTSFFHIIREIWGSGRVPDEWKDISIAPIPKAGRDLSVVENYRPIVLFNVPLKIWRPN